MTSTNCTIYVPGIPLDTQVVPQSSPTVESCNMEPMIINAPPLVVKTISFKPLKINDIVIHLSLQSQTACSRDSEGIYFYDKLTFTVKDRNDKILHSKVPHDKIEDIITKIYESSKKA